MAAQKGKNFLRETLPYSGYGSDFIRGCFAQPRHRTECGEKALFSGRTNPGTVIKKAFRDAPLHEQLVVAVGETVCLVPDALQQAECPGIMRKHKGL